VYETYLKQHQLHRVYIMVLDYIEVKLKLMKDQLMNVDHHLIHLMFLSIMNQIVLLFQGQLKQDLLVHDQHHNDHLMMLI
jgi:hypothetical protein